LLAAALTLALVLVALIGCPVASAMWPVARHVRSISASRSNNILKEIELCVFPPSCSVWQQHSL
jgi:hypothetical protein